MAEATTPTYCRRCGVADHPTSDGFCRCREAVGTLDEIRDLLEPPFDQRRSRELRRLRAPAARTPFEQVLRTGADDGSRDLALHVLGNIADPRSLEIVVAQVDDEADVPVGVARYLARLGTAAGDELLARWAAAGSSAAMTGLAHRRDPRAAPHLLDAIEHGRDAEGALSMLREIDPSAWCAAAATMLVPMATGLEAWTVTSTDREMAGRTAESIRSGIVARFGEDGLLDPAVQFMLQRAESETPEDAAAHRASRYAELRSRRLRSLIGLAGALQAADPEGATEAIERADAELGPDVDLRAAVASSPRLDPVAPTEQARPPDGPVPAWSLDFEPGDPDHPGTRFGGRPTWLERPTWPLTPIGTPMAFWCQLRLPDDAGRMAYVFLDPNDVLFDEDDPLMSTGSVFLQPGGVPAGPWTDDPSGPTVPDRRQRDRIWSPPSDLGFDARVPRLQPFGEPPSWEDAELTADQERWAWNKVGGTPLFLQSPPATDGWEFLAEFQAEAAGYELADGAQCYVFIDRVRGTGFLTWDCH